MTALEVIGCAIALNVGVLTAGVVWSKRQVKRVAAERAAEYRGLFKLQPLPPPGDEVQILVEEEDGRTSQLEAVHWLHLGWTDAITLLRIEEEVLGWRWHPSRERRQDDPSTWPREKLAAEIDRLYGNGPNDA